MKARGQERPRGEVTLGLRLAPLLAVILTACSSTTSPRLRSPATSGASSAWCRCSSSSTSSPRCSRTRGSSRTQSELYRFVRAYLLPASLVLLVLSVDLPAIARLGRSAVVIFLAGAVGIVLGGPLAYLALGWLVPAELGDQAWKGLAALSGSWIGGSANFVAIGQSVGAHDSTLSMMVVVDVGVSNIWTAVLLSFAGRERQMDARMGADRQRLDAVRDRGGALHA